MNLMEPGTPEWDRAWAELGERAKAIPGLELQRPAEPTYGWQYMGPDTAGEFHTFRLRAGMYGNMTGANLWEKIRIGGARKCPLCGEAFNPKHATRDEAMKQGDAESREQWISGCCSTACWDKVTKELEA